MNMNNLKDTLNFRREKMIKMNQNFDSKDSNKDKFFESCINEAYDFCIDYIKELEKYTNLIEEEKDFILKSKNSSILTEDLLAKIKELESKHGVYEFDYYINQLKPCPFCGQRIRKFDYSNDRPKPRVRIKHFCYLNDDDTFSIEMNTNWQKSEKECIKIWNKRSELF